MAASHAHSPRTGAAHSMAAPPSFEPFHSHSNYHFGTSFASSTSSPQHSQISDPRGHPPPVPTHSPFPGPTSTYRFGGPPTNPTNAPLDPPSYFDYSMRRHSLTTNQSPNRYSNELASGSGAPGHLSSANSSTKRKSSAEDGGNAYNDGSYYPSQQQQQQQHSQGSENPPSYQPGHPPPNSKRKTGSAMAPDKMNKPEAGNEGQRRESYSPSWEERRASDESYRSSGSQGSYSMFHPGQAGSGTGNPSHQPANHANPHQSAPSPFARPPASNPPPPQFYDDQVGPRGSIARGMYEPEHQNFGRRPSIPGVSQMIQGQAPFYPGQAPHSAPATAQHPPPPSNLPRMTSNSSQLSVTISSAAQSNDSHHAHTNIPPPSQHLNGYPVGPPPQWPSSAPSNQPARQGSTGSLDPNSSLKDSPYSRSPELRVSHKLAERKRRKEMAELFDDLRESLPGEKGVKSSKFEILTKAVEFIGQLKTFNRDLQNDNQNLRHHLNLPQAQPPTHEMRSNQQPTPHPLQPAPQQYVDHSRPSSAQPQQQQQQQPPTQPQQHVGSPRPHPSRTGSHASSHASSLSMDNGHPANRE